METTKFKNPLVLQRADPWVYKHTDGYYYFTASVPQFDRIELRRARKIEELCLAEPKTVWFKHEKGIMSANIWAPEIHYVDRIWYIYFAAAHTSKTNEGLYDHRIYVLENESPNPLDGQWAEKGQIKTEWETFALDATTFTHNGTRYLVWGQKDPKIKGNSNLYIAKMSNPWKLDGGQVMISKPEYEWETVGFRVNEGPAVIKHGGKIFITYSASATDSNYCMGMLSADVSSDLLNKSSWKKSNAPIFASCDKTSVYGPGHNCFTTDESERDIMIYHARGFKEISGDPLYDPNRDTYAKYLEWDEEGNPVLGKAE
jgi:GH43 family beta-xylosidase